MSSVAGFSACRTDAALCGPNRGTKERTAEVQSQSPAARDRLLLRMYPPLKVCRQVDQLLDRRAVLTDLQHLRRVIQLREERVVASLGRRRGSFSFRASN